MSIATEFVRGTRRTADAGIEDLNRFRARLDKSLREARRDVARRAHAADRYVHGHPWTAVAIAAGAAAVAGLATARLLRKRH